MFYADLGFWRVEGKDAEGWAVITNGEARLGLYESEHMGDNLFTLNFRGGDVPAIVENLTSQGHVLEMQGESSATLLDPDGYALFFGTAPGETKRVAPISEN